ncbi:MAG: cupredoxin domain-containing protein [Chloroflexota bacterium]|nr:cupredoxin domain-containing protein [Chloroflexota bacterium]MDE2886351.1 cupredoxin domain-containing protein [Chloroflexota bacterium]
MKTRVTAILALIAVVAVSSILAGCGPSGPTPTPAVPTDGVLDVDMRNYVYEPRTFEFKVGETVEFRLISEDEPHTFTVRDLGINWVVPVEEEPQVQAFTFRESGTFEIICTVAGHEASGMVGKITVVE